MALAVAVLPAILLDKLTGFPGGLGNEFGFAIAVGFPVVAIVASVLDLARVSVRTFALSFCIGILAVQGIVLGAFAAQVNLSSYQRAYSLFDFDQPDRLVAWQIMCGSMGLYFSIPIALLWKSVQVARRVKSPN